jgi:hypothetical protein
MRLIRFIMLLALIAPVYTFSATPVNAGVCTTHNSSRKSLEEPRWGLWFYGEQKLYYCANPTYFQVSWSDMYLNVMETHASLQCTRCRYSRVNATSDNSVVDDNSPSTFDYWNTPTRSEVYLVPFGNFYWGADGTPIRFYHRATTEIGACDTYSSPTTVQWSQFAGVDLHYHPNYGFFESYAWLR